MIVPKLTTCLFVSDLHGHLHKYESLFKSIVSRRPGIVFIGGDYLPSGFLPGAAQPRDFVDGFLIPGLKSVRATLAERYPAIFLIMGNDDERAEEHMALTMEREGLLQYVHDKMVGIESFQICGYSYVPPTPFLLKDWERYDVSRYVDPGSVSPEDGRVSVAISHRERRLLTIKADLERLTGEGSLERTVFLFHAPPHDTCLDRADLDGVRVEGVQLDLHVGSIAIRRFIETRQPLLSLHGHIHESARLSGSWRDRIGRTHLFSAAHDGPELSLISFDLEDLENARRDLI